MSVKKAFLPLHTMLAACAVGTLVSDVMENITELCSAKGAGGGSASHRNDAGEVVAVLDYYFKVWLPVDLVEFGAKANSNTGLNTMCKLGVSHWTKQQRLYKLGKEQLLDDVAAQLVEPSDIQSKLDDLEKERIVIASYPVPEIAFTNLDDLLKADPKKMTKAVEAYIAAEAKAAEAATKAAEATAKAAEAEAA